MVTTYKIAHHLLGCLGCKTLAKVEIIFLCFGVLVITKK